MQDICIAITNEVTGPLQGGQDQASVPQVPLLGHGDAIETPSIKTCSCAMPHAFGVFHDLLDAST